MLFYDVSKKKKVNVDKYDEIQKRTKKGRLITMARAKSPLSGIMMYRILSNSKA